MQAEKLRKLYIELIGAIYEVIGADSCNTEDWPEADSPGAMERARKAATGILAIDRMQAELCRTREQVAAVADLYKVAYSTLGQPENPSHRWEAITRDCRILGDIESIIVSLPAVTAEQPKSKPTKVTQTTAEALVEEAIKQLQTTDIAKLYEHLTGKLESRNLTISMRDIRNTDSHQAAKRSRKPSQSKSYSLIENADSLTKKLVAEQNGRALKRPNESEIE